MHHEQLERVVATIVDRWPAATVAVSGSIAAGTHGPGSDIDVLLAAPDVRRSLHGVWSIGGVSVSYLVIALQTGEEAFPTWASRFNWTVLNYVADAKPLHDPDGALSALIERAARYRLGLRSNPSVQARHIRREVAVLARRVESGRMSSRSSRIALRADAYQAGVTLWLLERGLLPASKSDGRSSVRRLQEADPAHHTRLAAFLSMPWPEVGGALERLAAPS